MEHPEAPQKPKRAGKAAGGRPRLKPEEKRVKLVPVRLTQARYDELKELAADRGRTVADVIHTMMNRQIFQISPEQTKMLRQLSGMANNLNQLAKRANADGFGTVGNQIEQEVIKLHAVLDYFVELL